MSLIVAYRSLLENFFTSIHTKNHNFTIVITQYIYLLICLQVIVMSSHETIRVLEVEVDATVPSPETHVKTEAEKEEGRVKALELAEGANQDKKTASSTIPTGGATFA